MLYLILAVASSAAVSVLMRVGEKRIRSEMGMFLVNYIVCEALSLLFMKRGSVAWTGPGWKLAVGMGTLTGVLYLVNFVLLKRSIKRSGVVLSSTFMKLGVLIPTLMAIVVFRERPRAVQIVGIALALAAIVLMYYEKGGGMKSGLSLIVLLLLSGVTDSMANTYDELGDPAMKDAYLLIVFGAALLCALILFLKKREKLTGADALFGALLGLPNYFSSRFLLLALHDVDAVIVYPAFSVGTITLVFLAGIFLFKEKPGLRRLIALAVIAVALALLNL